MSQQDANQVHARRGLPSWIKVTISLAILAAIVVGVVIYFTQDLVKTADGQLVALRERDFSRAYYEYTAKDFKTATSLEAFTEFIKSHPALARNAQAHFNERSIDKNVGKLHATLSSTEGNVTPVEYKFVKEGERWKILSMRLLASGALTSGTALNRNAELVQPVEGQLNALRSNDIAKAYFGFASKDFQEKTPLKAFKEFIKNYPILTKHHSTTFSEGTVDGNQATLNAVMHADDLTTNAEYKLVNEEGKWKIWSMRLNLPVDATNRVADSSEADALQEPIEAFLAYLRADDFSNAYYENTTREFQAATSLDAFRDFVRAYPALTDHKGVLFKDPSIQQEAATVTTLLEASEGSSAVEYQLVRTPGDRWRIWSMQILTKPTSGVAPSAFNTSDLVNAIEAQLAAIRGGDLARAYYVYTAKEFQRSTPLGAFEKFIQAHPVLFANEMANFSHLSFKNDIGTFQGELTSEKGEANKVEFDLIYEGGKWRVLSMQLYPRENQPIAQDKQVAYADEKGAQLHQEKGSRGGAKGDKSPASSAENQKPQGADRYPSRPLRSSTCEISAILVGTDLDANGFVENARKAFSPSMANFHVDVVVNRGRVGDKANLILEHLESKTRVPPVETALETEGESTLSFVFTPPNQGWPRGNYRVIARTHGDEKTYQFRVQ